MTIGGMKDYQWKERSQPREGRKSSKGRKGNDYGKDERLPWKARKTTKGRKEVN